MKQSETIGYFCSQILQVQLRRERTHFVSATKLLILLIQNLKTPLDTEGVTLGDPSEKTNCVKLKIELNSPKKH